MAGKGHEDYQIIGTDKRHYSDRETVAAALHINGVIQMMTLRLADLAQVLDARLIGATM